MSKKSIKMTTGSNSPDLVPSDYYLFGPTKDDFRGKYYASDEVKTAGMK